MATCGQRCVMQLSRMEVASKQHVNPWEAAAALNSSGRDLTTRGGMRLGSYSGSTPLTPVKEPHKDSSSGGSPGPFAASHLQQDALPGNPQSPQHPHRQSDASDGLQGPQNSPLLLYLFGYALCGWCFCYAGAPVVDKNLS